MFYYYYYYYYHIVFLFCCCCCCRCYCRGALILTAVRIHIENTLPFDKLENGIYSAVILNIRVILSIIERVSIKR